MIRQRYPGIKFKNALRDIIFDSLSPYKRNILILDYQIGVASLSKSLADCFTK